MTRIARTLMSLALVGLVLGGCNQATTAAPKEEAIHLEEQASGLKQLTLSAKAAERLGIETAPVAGSGSLLTVPYAAIIYDAQGDTWSYVNAEPLVFLREQIMVDEIDGDTAILSAGPAVGTSVVTTGAAELYGAEIGVGGGH
jgi:hypothetical protein